MNVLIVHAHPEPKSFCTAMKDLAVETLQSAGHTVVVSDLYAMQFNPVAQRQDFTELSQEQYLVYALEQRNAYESGSLAADIVTEVEKLKAADLVIFNFPLFWGSVPAIMKGWIDRVLISGLCYGGRRIYDQGGLVGKKGLAALTLGGRDYMFAADGIHGALTDMLRPLLQNTMGYVGMTVVPPFAAYHVPYISLQERVQMLADYKQYLLAIDTHQPLKFPILAEYDRAMKKL